LYICASDFQKDGQLAQNWACVNTVNDLNIPKMQFLSSAINQPIRKIPCTAHIVSANKVKISDGLKLTPKILQFKNKQLALQYILSEITNIQKTQPAYFFNILFRYSKEVVTMHNHQVTSDDQKYQLVFGNCHLDFWLSHFITSNPETMAKCIKRH
jgi:hypothetical protein